jgi:hypothetical protein
MAMPYIQGGLPPGGYVPDMFQRKPERVNPADNIAPNIVRGFIGIKQGCSVASNLTLQIDNSL